MPRPASPPAKGPALHLGGNPPPPIPPEATPEPVLDPSLEPSDEAKKAAVETIRRSMEPAGAREIPPPPAGADCFLLDGKRVPISAPMREALRTLGEQILALAREFDPLEKPGEPTAWAWCRIRIGDCCHVHFLEIDCGGAKDAPGDGLPAVAILGA